MSVIASILDEKNVVYVQTTSSVHGRLIYQAVLTCSKKDLLICIHRDYNCMKIFCNQLIYDKSGTGTIWR